MIWPQLGTWKMIGFGMAAVVALLTLTLLVSPQGEAGSSAGVLGPGNAGPAGADSGAAGSGGADSGPAGANPAGSTAELPLWLPDLADYAVQHPGLLLPAKLPTGVREVAAMSGGQADVVLYSLDKVTVMTCPNLRSWCESAFRGSSIFASRSVGGQQVYLMVGAASGVERRRLSTTEQSFWKSVPLSSQRPLWLR